MDPKIEQLTAVIDSREQTPWNLAPMGSIVDGLAVGDYSIRGLESVIAIERKSLQDFVACCGIERDRFQRELDRLRGWPVSAVIIEADWSDLEAGLWRSRLTSNQVRASFTSWIAQGHRLILGHSPTSAASIARGILFYAARYRLRESATLLANMNRSVKNDAVTDHKKGTGEASRIVEDELGTRSARGVQDTLLKSQVRGGT